MTPDDINTCLKVGMAGLNVLVGLVLALCIAILLWA